MFVERYSYDRAFEEINSNIYRKDGKEYYIERSTSTVTVRKVDGSLVLTSKNNPDLKINEVVRDMIKHLN